MQYTAFDLEKAYKEMTGRRLRSSVPKETVSRIFSLYEMPDLKSPSEASGDFKVKTALSVGVAAVTPSLIMAASMLDYEPLVKYTLMSSLAVTHVTSWITMSVARRQEFG